MHTGQNALPVLLAPRLPRVRMQVLLVGGAKEAGLKDAQSGFLKADIGQSRPWLGVSIGRWTVYAGRRTGLPMGARLLPPE